MNEHSDAQVRQRIYKNCFQTKGPFDTIHSVSFQPRDWKDNQDRVVTEKWDICGQEWLFLAVLDGHLGPQTATYTSRTLPTYIRKKLCKYIQGAGGRLDRTNIGQHEEEVTKLLWKEVLKFDHLLGNELKRICPRPEELKSEEEARQFIDAHRDIVERAFSGTTLAFALINIEQRLSWAAGVGDSSVGLATTGPDGKVLGRRLCDFHTFKDPQEYFRVCMSHHTAENPLFDWDDRILGWMSVARAIGGFALKLRSAYLANLFQYLDFKCEPPMSTYIPKIISPPYMIAEPSVRFTDLQPFWENGTKLFLYTDGVDNLVDGSLLFTPQKSSGADPIQIVAELLATDIDPHVEQVLGHKVEPRWSRENENRAMDVMGNLLGGKDVERLEMATDQKRLSNAHKSWPFHVDDTTIIVWTLDV